MKSKTIPLVTALVIGAVSLLLSSCATDPASAASIQQSLYSIQQSAYQVQNTIQANRAAPPQIVWRR